MNLRDRIKGALAFAALGDALGLPNEAKCLQGNVGNLIQELPEANTFREPKPNPWNIWQTPQETDQLQGVVSDDTAVRIAFIEPWLTSSHRPTIQGFADFLTTHQPKSTVEQELQKSILDVIQSAQHQQPCPPFFDPAQPVNWDAYLFGTLPLVSDPVESPLNHTSRQHAIDTFHHLVKNSLGSGSLEESLLPALNSPDPIIRDIIGWANQSQRDQPQEFAQTLHKKLQKSVPNPLWAFDPRRQIATAAACLAYSISDPLKAIQTCALVPGDSDTNASHLGIIIGATTGYEKLQDHPKLQELSSQVEETTKALFKVSLDQRTDAYMSRVKNPE